MSDTYQTIANSPMGKALFGAINLPIPVILERWQPGQASLITVSYPHLRAHHTGKNPVSRHRLQQKHS